MNDGARQFEVRGMRWPEAVFGFGLGLAMLIAGLLWLSHQRAFLRSGQRVEGTIIDYIRKPNPGMDRPGEPFFPVFSYQDQLGQQHTITSSVGFDAGFFHAPEKVEVIYDQQGPGDAMIASAEYVWLAPLGLAVSGLLIIGYGVRAVWQRLARQ